MRFIDPTGRRYGRLVIVRTSGRDEKNRILIECNCDCGVTITRYYRRVTNGNCRSCGCLDREISPFRNRVHGMRYSDTYRTWANMKDRCLNPNCGSYKHYGMRGIAVDSEWMAFPNFLRDMGEKPIGLSLDRINNDGPYTKNNCRWAGAKVQGRNRRSSILDAHKANRIREFARSGSPTRELSELFGVKICTIQQVIRGDTWD